MQNVQRQHSIETTSPRHPVDQGVAGMLTTCSDGRRAHEAIRVPLEVCEDILGRSYSNTFADDQVIRVTLATDPNCPAWIRDGRKLFQDDRALYFVRHEESQPCDASSSNALPEPRERTSPLGQENAVDALNQGRKMLAYITESEMAQAGHHSDRSEMAQEGLEILLFALEAELRFAQGSLEATTACQAGGARS